MNRQVFGKNSGDWRGRKLAQFWFLFFVQTVANTIILWNGIPFYRRLLEANQQFDIVLVLIAAICSAAGQASYWLAMPLRREIGLSHSPLAAHLIQFLARLNFIYASAMFSVVFFVQFDNLDIRLWKASILLAMLFSMFCYTLQLEWIGKMMAIGHSPGRGRSAIEQGELNL